MRTSTLLYQKPFIAEERLKARLPLLRSGHAATNPPSTADRRVTIVYKFGGSSVADAERICAAADIIAAFPDELPCVVLSAMGRTTNLLLAAGADAVAVGADRVPSLRPLRDVKALHREACTDLGISDEAVGQVEKLLTELQQLLIGVSIMQELTARAQDSLVSFGERLSTRIFAAYLTLRGTPARQFDAWKLGLITSDEFTNAEILYSEAIPAVREAICSRVAATGEVPVVTGFLGRGAKTGAITTLGRGGSDLSATFLGAALGVREVVVWKDVDGVLTSDPGVVRDARVVPRLTFDEATELAYFGAQVLHPSAMQPAQIAADGALAIRVRNSYNLSAPGSLICARHGPCATAAASSGDCELTAIVVKPDVHLLDIVSTRMLGNYGFLARVFDVFKQQEISVDVVATSEISVSVTLDSGKMWTRDLVAEELEALAARFEGVATVAIKEDVSIVSLICDAARCSAILQKVFSVFVDEGVNVQMISQGASKTNISLIIPSKDACTAVQCLHAKFFGVSDACAASAAALDKATERTQRLTADGSGCEA